MKRTLLLANLILSLGFLANAEKTPDSMLGAALHQEEVQGDLKGAIAAYQKVLAAPGVSRKTAAEALTHMGQCYEKLGDTESRRVYERVVRDYSDQKEAVEIARTRLGRSNIASTKGPVARQLWTVPGKSQIFGRVSPDGRYLPYTDWAQNGDLFLHDLMTGANRRITNTATEDGTRRPEEFASDAAFSADMKKLDYRWFNQHHQEIRDITEHTTGISQPRRLFGDQEVQKVRLGDWSADGKWLAVQVSRKDHSSQMGLISLQDGSLKVLKSGGWRGSTRLEFSPDSKYLAYDHPVSETSDQRDVFVIAVDGSSVTTAVAHPKQDVLLGWSPDAKRLLFASDRGGSMAIWSVLMSEGKPQGAPELIRPAMAGNVLEVTHSSALYTLVSPSGPRSSEIQVAGFDFGTAQMLSKASSPVEAFVGANFSPAWSPDGKYLAYVSRRDTTGSWKNYVISIRSVETGQVRDLPGNPKLSAGTGIQWSPDSRAFLAQGYDPKGREGILRIDAQTGEVTPFAISLEGEYLGDPRWSADGKRIFFNRNFRSTQEVAFVQKDVASAAEQEMVRQKMDIPKWENMSPDGTKLYYRRTLVNKEIAFFERDLSSGKEREVIRRPFLGKVNLSPDGRLIATPSSGLAGTAKSSVFILIPLDGGDPRELMRATEPERIGFGLWAPDSRSLLLSKLSSDGHRELWWSSTAGGAPRKLDLETDKLTPASVDPSGRQIAFVMSGPARPDEVWVLENFLPKLSAKR